MAELKEEKSIYYIPENFIEEGRIFQGRIKVRNLIEGAVLSLGSVIIGLCIIGAKPEMEISAKITIMIALCAIPMGIGLAGYNGDPVSVVLKSARQWRKNKTTMLYNSTPKLLKRDPVMAVMNRSRSLDPILEAMDTMKAQNIARKEAVDIVEGRDYVFARDEYVDDYTKELKKKKGKDVTDKYAIERLKTAEIDFSGEMELNMDLDKENENYDDSTVLDSFRERIPFENDGFDGSIDWENYDDESGEEDLF